MNIDGSSIILIRLVGLHNTGTFDEINAVLTFEGAEILNTKQMHISKVIILELLILVKKNRLPSIKDHLLKECNKISDEVYFSTIFTTERSKNINFGNDNIYEYILLTKEINQKQLIQSIDLLKRQSFVITSITLLTKNLSFNSREASPTISLKFALEGNPNNSELLHEEFTRLSVTQNMDYSFQDNCISPSQKRLICFDMDSTLIETEVIDELALRAGVGSLVKEITSRAMHGEIDFKSSFRKRVALLKGLDESVMKEIAENLPFTEGIDKLMLTLKAKGYKVAILSGGFTYFAHFIQRKYKLDYVYANQLEIIDGQLTGNYLGDIIDGDRKLELLYKIAEKEGIPMEHTVAVGDGANDLPMIASAGLGIAFHAKPKVQAKAKHRINHVGIDGVLYFMGLNELNTQ